MRSSQGERSGGRGGRPAAIVARGHRAGTDRRLDRSWGPRRARLDASVEAAGSSAGASADATTSVVGTLGWRVGRGRRVLELADRLRAARQRPTPAAPIRGDEPEQEDDRLAGHQEQEDHGEQQHGADHDRPVPGDGQRRQDDEDDQDDDLDPEAAEPRATFGLEVGAAVLDRAGRPRTAGRRRVGSRIDGCRRRRRRGRVGGRAPSDGGSGSGVWSVTGRNDTGGGRDAPHARGATAGASQVGGKPHMSAEDA